MIFFRKWISWLSIPLFLFSCEAGKDSTNELHELNRVLGQEWQLVELNGKPVSSFQLPDCIIMDGPAARIRGFGGCNRFAGTCNIKRDGSIHIGPLMATQMACQELPLEASFFRALEQANAWQYNDHSLFLFNNQQPLARFQLKDKAEALQAQAGNNPAGTWILESMPETGMDLSALFPERRPEIIVEPGDTILHGFGGCNHFSATCMVRDSLITITHIRSTRMYCEGNGEASYWKRLQQVNWLQQPNQHQLLLWRGNTLLLSFKRK